MSALHQLPPQPKPEHLCKAHFCCFLRARHLFKLAELLRGPQMDCRAVCCHLIVQRCMMHPRHERLSFLLSMLGATRSLDMSTPEKSGGGTAFLMSSDGMAWWMPNLLILFRFHTEFFCLQT